MPNQVALYQITRMYLPGSSIWMILR